MLPSEFYYRTGICDFDEYDRANCVYMLTDLDKDAFCADWVKVRDSPIVADLSLKLSKARNELENIFEKFPLLG